MMLASTIGTTRTAGTAGGAGWQSAVRRPAMVSITGTEPLDVYGHVPSGHVAAGQGVVGQ